MFRTLAIAWMLIATPLVQAQALMHCQLTDAATTPVGAGREVPEVSVSQMF